MYTFIGRDKELRTLQTAYESDRSELVVVYGRRRIGKTALMTQFCKDKAGVYFAAKRQDDAGQRQDFNETMKRAGAPVSRMLETLPNWEAGFRQLAALPGSGRKVMVLDEFPYMAEGNPTLPSLLQHLWDHELQSADVMIVLCGSALSFMEKEVVDNIVCAADILSKYIGSRVGIFDYQNKDKEKVAYPIIHSILMRGKEKKVYVTPFGVILQEPNMNKGGIELSIIRFTKHGKYTFLCRGLTTKTDDGISHENIGPILGNKYDLRNDQLNAKLFPRSYACAAAYHSFLQNHLPKVKEDESPFGYRVCQLLNQIFMHYQDARPTYFMIDLAVPNIIGTVITTTLAAHCVLTHEFNIS